MKKFDLIIVGGGAGMIVMDAALNHGLKCAIIEKDKFGGTCLTKGCIPSKMLVYPADYIREAENAKRFGIIAQKPEIDWKAISSRMWEQIDFSKQIEKRISGIGNLTLFKGQGSFINSKQMVIRYENEQEDEVIEGDRFIIATGAKSQIPKIEGLEETGYITSEDFFGKKYPEKSWGSLVVIGSGAISLEFAHIFSAFGTKVTMVARSERILKKEDTDISDFIYKQFLSNGIKVLTESDIISVAQDGKIKVVTVENRSTKKRDVIRGEEILVASGSQSTAIDLGLKEAGVDTDKDGWITTNEYLETSKANIWAIGDVNGKYQFRHKANHEAQVVAHNIFNDKEKVKVNYHATPWAIFTHPQVGRVGATEAELKDKGIPYLTAKNYYSEVVGGRAMGFKSHDEDDGFVKVLMGKDKKILGVHIVGPQAATLTQPFVYLMNMENKSDLRAYDVIDDSMIIHPSLSELTAWVLGKIDLSELQE